MNTKSKRILVLLLALIMIFPALSETAYAASLAFPMPKSEELTGELRGEVAGNQKVFTIDREKVEKIVESTQSVEQPRQTLRRSRRSILEEGVFSEQESSVQSMQPVGAPSNNTKVTLETKGLNGGTFDWKVFSNSQFNVKLGYTDASNHFVEVGTMTFTEGQTVIEANTNWPDHTANINGFQLVTDFDGNYDVRAYSEQSGTNPTSGVLELKLTVYELPNTNLKVQYQDIYGKPLTENLPADTDQAPKIKLNLGSGVEFDLPKSDKEVNLRDLDAVEDNISEATADALADLMKTDNLNAVEKLSFTISNATEGEHTFGSGDTAKNYKYKIEHVNVGRPGELHDFESVVTMTYQADVAVPPMKDDDQTQPVDVPTGYVRLTFYADEKSPGTTKGRFDDSGTKTKYIDVKEGIAYNNAKLQEIIAGFNPVALKADGNVSDTLVFETWDPTFPTAETSPVTTKEYNAKYTDKYTQDDIIPYLPGETTPTKGSDGKTIPTNFIDVVFKSEDATKGEVKVGQKQGVEVKAKVRPNTDLSTSREISAVPKEHYGFTVWSPELTTITTTSAKEFTAKFVKSGDKIQPNDPIPQNWYKVTVKQDDESIQAGTVTESVYTVAPNDKLTTQGAFPDLTGKENDGYKNPAWYKDSETSSIDNPSTVAITKDATFTAKAKEQSTADKIKSLGGLKGKDFGVWKDTPIDAKFWNKGIAPADGVQAANKQTVQDAIDAAKVEDTTTPGRTTTAKGTFAGTLKVTFADGSVYEVEPRKEKSNNIYPSPIKKSDKSIYGKGAPNAQIVLTKKGINGTPDTQIDTCKVNSAGDWEVKIQNGFQDGEIYYITQQEPNKTFSNPVVVTVKQNRVVYFIKEVPNPAENISQTLYVYDKGDKKPDPQQPGGETPPVPEGTIFVEFTRDETSIKEDGFENLKPLMYAENDTVDSTKFPAAKAEDGYNQATVTWKPAKDTALTTTNQAYKAATKTFTFKAIAKQETTAEKIEALGGLKAKDFGVWVGTDLTVDKFWRKGVQAKDSAKETEINALLNKATSFTDLSNRTATSEVLDPEEGKIKITFPDSEITVEKQKLYVWAEKTEVPKGKEDVTPDGSILVQFKAGTGIKNQTAGTVLSQKTFKANTTLVEGDFPTVEAADGTKKVVWTPTDLVVTETNKTFTANATDKTVKEQIEALGGLDPEDIKVWVGDTIDWSKGVKAKNASNKNAIDTLLIGAKVTDLSNRSSSTATGSPFTGNLKVVFSDNSEITVNDQKLYVSDKVTSATNKNAPDDAIVVKLRLGEGVKAEYRDPNTQQVTQTIDGDKDNPVVHKTYKVKPGTDLSTYIHPVLNNTIFKLVPVEPQSRYIKPVWKGNGTNEGFEVSQTNNVFTATATKKSEKDVIPWVPTDPTRPEKDKPTVDPDGNTIVASEYITVIYKVSPKGSGKLKLTYTKADNSVVDYEGETIAALVKKDAEFSTIKPTTSATGEYKFWYWATELNGKFTKLEDTHKAKDKDKYIARFVKSGTDITNDDPNVPLPTGLVRATFVAGTGVNAFAKKVLAVKKGTSKADILALQEAPRATVDTARGYIGDVIWTDEPVIDSANGIQADTKLTATAKMGSAPAPKPREGFTIYFAPKADKKSTQRHMPYMTGYPDGSFKPDGKITRAEVSTIFARLLEANNLANYVAKYSDVKPQDWFVDSVMKLSAKDVIKGYPDGTFKPNKNITRAEFAIIASKYSKSGKMADETFYDVPATHWAKYAIAKVKAEGWITGYPDGSFKPDAPITRAEAVAIVNRMFNRRVDVDFANKNSHDISSFGDLNAGHWAYYEIIEATTDHEFERANDSLPETWTKIVNK